MSDIAIKVENLSKRYRIGLKEELHDTLAGALADFVTKPVQNLRRLRRLSTFSEDGHDPEDIIWALKDVSFEVKRGEVVGVVGPNGAGKTTLLKILSRITEPTGGRVEIQGRVSSLLEVGTGFHPELTGRENIFLNGAVLGMTKADIKRKFDEIVDFSGVEKFIDTHVKRYSTGMKVRLAFSVAAHLDPEILLIDEVLSVGDAEFQKKCLGKMGDVTQQGRTVLFVSHNMASVKALCNRAMLLDRGHIIAEGEVGRVVDSYLRPDIEVSDTGVIPHGASRTGTGDAKVRTVRLTDLSGKLVSELFFGQPFRVTLGFEVLTDIADAAFLVSIVAGDGTLVASSYSTAGGKQPIYLSAGRHRVSVDIDVVLLPRSYTLAASIFHAAPGRGKTIDQVQHILDFSVLSVAEDGHDGYPWYTVHGYVRPESLWRLAESEHRSLISDAGMLEG